MRVMRIDRTPPDECQEILDRCFADLVERTRAEFRARGEDPAIIAPDFIAYWLRQGKTPQDVVNIALGRRKPDAHLGGRDA